MRVKVTLQLADKYRMTVLILEDNFVCRTVLLKLMSRYGECHVAVQGLEAVEAFEKALDAGRPYDLVCLDIMVPLLDGHSVLKAMRAAESKKGILPGHGTRIVMATALADMKNVMSAYSEFCDGYLTKPITRDSVANTLRELKLLPTDALKTAA
jgi:two-component system chemotaxis response regulator CheY